MITQVICQVESVCSQLTQDSAGKLVAADTVVLTPIVGDIVNTSNWVGTPQGTIQLQGIPPSKLMAGMLVSVSFFVQ